MFIAQGFLSKVIKKDMANTPFQHYRDGERTYDIHLLSLPVSET